MMKRPEELDVPHWARSMVDNYRSQMALPTRVTDRMIYARLQRCYGWEPDQIIEQVAHLIKETEDM